MPRWCLWLLSCLQPATSERQIVLAGLPHLAVVLGGCSDFLVGIGQLSPIESEATLDLAMDLAAV